eukprot:8817386-Alexandrium_andersonii.AAC.1
MAPCAGGAEGAASNAPPPLPGAGATLRGAGWTPGPERGRRPHPAVGDALSSSTNTASKSGACSVMC